MFYVKKFIKSVWVGVLDSIFPSFCIGCGNEGSFLCDNCFSSIPISNKQFEICTDPLSLDAILSCSSYKKSPLLKKLIHSLKYDFIEDLANPLGEIMAKTLKISKTLEFGSSIICPVPLHKKRLKWRGFKQSELIARTVSAKMKIPMRNLIIRTRFKKAQMELSRDDRMKNVEQTFIVNEDLTNATFVILIDDVATTLSTLNECAKALKIAGAKKVYGIVLARVE